MHDLFVMMADVEERAKRILNTQFLGYLQGSFLRTTTGHKVEEQAQLIGTLAVQSSTCTPKEGALRKVKEDPSFVKSYLKDSFGEIEMTIHDCFVYSIKHTKE